MSLSLALAARGPFALPAPMASSRKPGRPPAAVTRPDRIKCVGLLLSGYLLGKQAGTPYGVSRATVYRWCGALLADGQPDTDHLRRLADSRRN